MSKRTTRTSGLWTPVSRRQVVAGLAACWTTRGLFAEQLTATPRMTEGPFYPDRMPLDTDNDLIILGDELTPSVGNVLHVSGRVLSESGEPVRGALVELWQVDANGMYIHSGSAGRERDPMFQGYGRFLTGLDGRYYFRTIRPIAYPGRTPHIHFAVSKGGKRQLTTQMLFADEKEANARDGLFRRVAEDKRSLLLAKTEAVSGSRVGEIQTSWDMVLGATPDERRR